MDQTWHDNLVLGWLENSLVDVRTGNRRAIGFGAAWRDVTRVTIWLVVIGWQLEIGPIWLTWYYDACVEFFCQMGIFGVVRERSVAIA